MIEGPLFSVLIANYNNSCYLLEAINSVKDQTYTNWEIIIVDDFSTDSPHELYVNLVKNNRIKVIYNERNYGAGYTFRRCMENSNGEYCGMLGPDDTLDKTAIEKMVTKHLELPNASLIYSLNFACNEKLESINNTILGGSLAKNENQLTSNGNNRITSFATFKTSYYNKTSGIDKTFKRAVDQDFYYKMEEVGEIFCIPEPLYYYRIHDRNISRNNNSVKAVYWKYVADRNAFNRRRIANIKIKNITYGELQRRYIYVCLLKIDEKRERHQYNNLPYYYCQLLKLLPWDKDFQIIKRHLYYIIKLFKPK